MRLLAVRHGTCQLDHECETAVQLKLGEQSMSNISALRHKYVIVKKSDILTRFPSISFPAATRVLLLPLPLPLERSRNWSSSKVKIVKICYYWHPIKFRFLFVFSCSVRIPSLCLLVFLVFSFVISYPNDFTDLEELIDLLITLLGIRGFTVPCVCLSLRNVLAIVDF